MFELFSRKGRACPKGLRFGGMKQILATTKYSCGVLVPFDLEQKERLTNTQFLDF
jgi:hypothetical protein